MRKLVISLAAASAAIAFAAPASAQYYPQPAYGYGQAYGQPAYGYGYGQGAYGYNGAANVQQLDMRIAGVRSHINAMAARGQLRHNRARSLDRQATNLQRSLRSSASNGVNLYEGRSLEQRVARLEQQVRQASLRGRYAPSYTSNRW